MPYTPKFEHCDICGHYTRKDHIPRHKQRMHFFQKQEYNIEEFMKMPDPPKPHQKCDCPSCKQKHALNELHVSEIISVFTKPR
jgi:hypothetical protein